MTIETKYNLGDTVWFFSKDGIQSGEVDDIDISVYLWRYNHLREVTTEGPSILYRIKTEYGNTSKYNESQLWRTKEEMPI